MIHTIRYSFPGITSVAHRHMLCVASAWFQRDWVNGDVYFWNTISSKVTLMSLDILQTMYVKWVIIFMWEPDQDT
jgi:hypothetical protein